MSKQNLWRIAAIGWMGVIFYMSSKQSTGPSPVPDYVYHFVVFFILAVFYFHSLRGIVDENKKLLAICVILTSLYGLSDEFHQYFVPTRTMSLKDWFVDSLAGFTAPYILFIRNK